MSSEVLTERLPPHNREAERGVIGGSLRDTAIISDLVQIIRPEDFYYDAHQRIWRAIVDLYHAAQPPDLISLFELIRQRGEQEDVGGVGYLAEIWSEWPTGANATYHAQIIKNHALVRNLIHTSNEILRDAYDQSCSGLEQVETAERKIMQIAQNGMTTTTVTIREAMIETMNLIDARKHPEFFPGVMSGYTDLDNLLAGFRNSELSIIAARPGVGKTVVALNFLRHIILHDNHAAFFVSLEMAKTELCERLLSAQAKVDGFRLRKSDLNVAEIEKLIAASGVLSKTKLTIDDTPNQSMLRIAANARRLKQRQDIKIVLIDYLQLIDTTNKRAPRHEQVGEISRQLKFLAKELAIPVIALSQVNRTSEDRQDHRPRLADLRESGNLEQDADNVLLLFRPDMHDESATPNTLEIDLAKHRAGPTGMITLTYLKQYMRFENYIADSADMNFFPPGTRPTGTVRTD